MLLAVPQNTESTYSKIIE